MQHVERVETHMTTLESIVLIMKLALFTMLVFLAIWPIKLLLSFAGICLSWCIRRSAISAARTPPRAEQRTVDGIELAGVPPARRESAAA